MAKVPQYQSKGERRSAIGFAPISEDEIWATGVTIEQVKTLLLRQGSSADIEIKDVGKGDQKYSGTSPEWSTINGRPLTEDERQRSVGVGIISVKGPGALQLLEQAQSAFGLLLRSELAVLFIEAS
jgi:hypothetical protein